MGAEAVMRSIAVPAQAGIPSRERALYFQETPAFAGVTELSW
ncbi:hypothetical protein [Sphingomonas sp.]